MSEQSPEQKDPRAGLPNRQSIRMRGWDYTAPGWYFVTINTHHGRALFGTVVNGRMVLSGAGRVAEDCWRQIPAHFPTAQMDEFVIMPNHLHGLVRLCPCRQPTRPGRCGGRLQSRRIANHPQGRAIARPYIAPIGWRIGDLASQLLGCDCPG